MGRPCELGCTCGRHRLTDEHRQRLSESMRRAYERDPTYRERLSEAVTKAYAEDPTYRERTSEAMRAVRARPGVRADMCEPGCMCGKHRVRSAEHRARLASRARRSFTGGDEGEAFAAVLCPAGFVREYLVQWGPGPGDCFQLDFVHVEGKINIELDGPFHGLYPSRYTDAERDALLRSLGWRVIRIRHS